MQQKSVLIVEDYGGNRILLLELLRSKDYAPVAVENGAKAMATVRQTRPDLILMDIGLPDISGIKVNQWLKEQPDLRAIPVIAVTAFLVNWEERLIRAAGFDDFIAKPFTLEAFYQTVERVLASREVAYLAPIAMTTPSMELYRASFEPSS